MRRPGSGLRLSHPATPAPPLTLGVRHLSGGAAHPCSGRLTCSAGSRIRPRGATFGNVSGLRFACIPAPLPRGRAVGLGARHLSCGDSHCARGDRHLSCGAAHSLCVVPVLPVRLNACALSIPIAGRCPRPDGLPQYRYRGTNKGRLWRTAVPSICQGRGLRPRAHSVPTGCDLRAVP